MLTAQCAVAGRRRTLCLASTPSTLVQASGTSYVFDLDVGATTVMPGDVDDDDGHRSFRYS